MGDEIVVLITASSGEEAAKIAKALVDERIVACVNIVSDVRSLFFWEGKTQDARESLLICKSRQPLMGKLVDRVKTLHSYSVPELLALPVIAGSRDYLDWMKETVRE